MPAALDPAKRAAIVAAIQGGNTRNAIARMLGVSGHVVSKIAEEDQLDTSAWDRVQTKRATAARTADLAARRTELAELLMDDAFDLRERMWEPQQQVVVVAVGKGVTTTEIVDVETNAGDFRNYLTAIGIAVDKVGVLTRDDGAEKEAVSLIRSLVDDIRARHGEEMPDSAVASG